MPLFAQERLPIPTKDILSWCHDNRDAVDQDSPIYIDCDHPNSTISHREAFALIRKLVAGFRAAGLKKGDCVCLHSFNNLYYPIIVQGIIGAGGCFVGTNPAYTRHELHHALNISKSRFVIAERELIETVEVPAAELGIHASRIFVLDSGPGHTLDKRLTWRTLLEHSEQDWECFDDYESARTTTAMLLFSSGTTGLPKAAQVSHYNLVAEHTLVHEHPQHPESYIVSRHVSTPMFHAATAPYTHVTCLRSGYQAYIMRRFEVEKFLINAERYQITQFMILPTMINAILALAKSKPDFVKRCLQSFISGVSGGAPLDINTQAAFQALLPSSCSFTQMWAMSETSCICCYFYPPEKDSSGSVGRFLPNVDIKLVGDEGDETASLYDLRGEMCVRGPNVIRGYLNDPNANQRDFDSDGFFHTGDIMYCNSKTKLWYVVDRKKELIKVRGFQVAPGEIEGMLLTHPDVNDAAVIGVEGGASGELPRAYLVRKEGSTLDAADVLKYMDGRLAKYKRLDGGVRFVDSIPKTASGKILKRVLREAAKKEGQGVVAKL